MLTLMLEAASVKASSDFSSSKRAMAASTKAALSFQSKSVFWDRHFSKSLTIHIGKTIIVESAMLSAGHFGEFLVKRFC